MSGPPGSPSSCGWSCFWFATAGRLLLTPARARRRVKRMWADFHFLRPFWLLLILLIPVMYLAFRQLSLGDSGWSRLIPARLLSPLIRHDGSSGKAAKSPLAPATAALVILFLALAGPAWREAPTPLKQPGDSLVIALDLSLSMLATDVEPDRLTRAKRKIRDILELREGSLTGLLVRLPSRSSRISRIFRLARVRRSGSTSVASMDRERSSAITRLSPGCFSGVGASRQAGPASARDRMTRAAVAGARGDFAAFPELPSWRISGDSKRAGISRDQPLSPRLNCRNARYMTGISRISKSQNGRRK